MVCVARSFCLHSEASSVAPRLAGVPNVAISYLHPGLGGTGFAGFASVHSQFCAAKVH